MRRKETFSGAGLYLKYLFATLARFYQAEVRAVAEARAAEAKARAAAAEARAAAAEAARDAARDCRGLSPNQGACGCAACWEFRAERLLEDLERVDPRRPETLPSARRDAARDALLEGLNATGSEAQLARLAPLVGSVGGPGLWHVRSRLDGASAWKLLHLLGSTSAAADVELGRTDLEPAARRLLLDVRALARDFLVKHPDPPAVGVAEVEVAAAALRDFGRLR